MAKKNAKISTQNMQIIESLYPDLASLHQRLEKVVHPDILKQIEVMQEKMVEVFGDKWDEEEDDFDTEYSALSEIADKNNFMSVWSTDIKSKQMQEKMPKAMSLMSYNTGEHVYTQKLPRTKKLTWLEVWKIADELMRTSGDDHHIFIEDIVEDKANPGCYAMVTGS